MDPGAELNLVSSSMLSAQSQEKKILIHAREACEIILTNNGKEIGRVKEAVYLSFVLDNMNGDTQMYEEWFHVWPHMEEEMILGSKFCREQEFTSFHTRLVPWDESYWHAREKQRAVDSVSAVIPEKDMSVPRERGSEQLLPCPVGNSERVRERVVTTCEKIDGFQATQAKKQRVETEKTAGEESPLAQHLLRMAKARKQAMQITHRSATTGCNQNTFRITCDMLLRNIHNCTKNFST